jgi:hypothetical protein
MKDKYHSVHLLRRFATVLAITTAALAILPGCRHASYSGFQGTGAVQGTGGTVRSMEGIDIWENGTPNRRYNILGVSDQMRNGRNRDNYDNELCKLAQKHGGNAVIVSDDPGDGKRMIKAQIIRYVP